MRDLCKKVLDSKTRHSPFAHAGGLVFESHELPLVMLSTLCADQELTFDLDKFDPPTSRQYLDACLWALRLVHSLNMAQYFGVDNLWLESITLSNLGQKEQPLLLEDFLDILHPQMVVTDDRRRARLVDFCRRVLEAPPRNLTGRYVKDYSLSLLLSRELPVRSFAVISRLNKPVRFLVMPDKWTETKSRSLSAVPIPQSLLILCRFIVLGKGLYLNPIVNSDLETETSWELLEEVFEPDREIRKFDFVQHEKTNEIIFKSYSADIKCLSLRDRLKLDNLSYKTQVSQHDYIMTKYHGSVHVYWTGQENSESFGRLRRVFQLCSEMIYLLKRTSTNELALLVFLMGSCGWYFVLMLAGVLACFAVYVYHIIRIYLYSASP